MNKVVTLILPTYAKTVHYGQTPNAFQKKTITKFENVLIERSNLVLRDDGTKLQAPDSQGQGAVQLVRRYTVVLDFATAALAEVVAAALDLFSLETVDVIVGENAQVWGRDEIEAFGTGIHAWNSLEVQQ